MITSIKPQIVPFNQQYFINNPHQKVELLKFYCNIWKYDPFFAEYQKCPICHRFYSQNEVEKIGIKTCSGTPPNTHPLTVLEEGWTPDIVDEDLRSSMAVGKDFFGAIAVIPPFDRIVGFVWGYAIDYSVLSAKWTQESVQIVNETMPCTKVTYFQEIASDPAFRGQGLGSSLVKILTSWMKQNYPSLPSMLHTHEKGPAYHLFQRVGYYLLARNDRINSGRILMAIKQSSQLTPENL